MTSVASLRHGTLFTATIVPALSLDPETVNPDFIGCRESTLTVTGWSDYDVARTPENCPFIKCFAGRRDP
jgi:hypothetical protein